jgi:hypothetical protein
MSGFISSDGSALSGALNPSSVGQALQVDGSGNLKVTTGSGNIVTVIRAAATVLNQASASQTTSGNSADLTVGSYAELTVDCNITAVSGTLPTVQFFLDRKGSDTIYYPVWQSVTVISAGQVSTSIGAGMSIAQGFGNIVRLRWVIGGSGGPSVTFSASIVGK